MRPPLIRIIFVLFSILGFINSAHSQDPSRRRKLPVVAPEPKRQKTPQKRVINGQARSLAKQIYKTLLAKRYIQVEKRLNVLKQLGTFQQSRRALLELLPDPKDLSEIKKNLAHEPSVRRQIILEWLPGKKRKLPPKNAKAKLDFLFPKKARHPKAKLY